MYGRMEFFPILKDFVPYQGCCPKRREGQRGAGSAWGVKDRGWIGVLGVKDKGWISVLGGKK